MRKLQCLQQLVQIFAFNFNGYDAIFALKTRTIQNHIAMHSDTVWALFSQSASPPQVNSYLVIARHVECLLQWNYGKPFNIHGNNNVKETNVKMAFFYQNNMTRVQV